MNFITPIKARALWFVARGRELEDGRKRVGHAYGQPFGRTVIDPPIRVMTDEIMYITRHWNKDGYEHMEYIIHGPRQPPRKKRNQDNSPMFRSFEFPT